MPYIVQAERDAIRGGKRPENVGQLNYCLTIRLQRIYGDEDWDTPEIVAEELESICRQYIVDKKELCYQLANDVLGALICCKLEMWRRARPSDPKDVWNYALNKCIKRIYREIVAPYEDKKIKENGDVDTYLT
ncbi:MAG: hypothetical protein Q8R25_00095 [bacterium]|nr:hypothetical protein [bacterium]